MATPTVERIEEVLRKAETWSLSETEASELSDYIRRVAGSWGPTTEERRRRERCHDALDAHAREAK